MNEKFFEFVRPIRIAMITMVSFLALFLALLSLNVIKSWSAPLDPTKTASITVNGTGKVSAKPDVASFSFAVNEQGTTAGDAQNKATDIANKAIAYLKSQGIADKDIKTEGYNSNPRYEYQPALCLTNRLCPPNKQVLVGYEVTESIQVKVRDTQKAGAILAGITSVGVKNMSGLSLTLDNPDTANASSRQKAIDDAKAKASALASQLGVELVRITDFQEGNNNRPIMYAAKSMAPQGTADAAVAPEIPTGENDYVSNVTITYEIR
jgi:uncharacterized protein YggE